MEIKDVQKFKIREVRKWQLLSAFLLVIVIFFLIGKFPLVINWFALIFLTLVVLAFLVAKVLQDRREVFKDLEIKKRIQRRIMESDNIIVNIRKCQKYPLSETSFLYDFYTDVYCVWYSMEKHRIVGYLRLPLKQVLDLIQKNRLTEALIETNIGSAVLRERLKEEGVSLPT